MMMYRLFRLSCDQLQCHPCRRRCQSVVPEKASNWYCLFGVRRAANLAAGGYILLSYKISTSRSTQVMRISASTFSIPLNRSSLSVSAECDFFACLFGIEVNLRQIWRRFVNLRQIWRRLRIGVNTNSIPTWSLRDRFCTLYLAPCVRLLFTGWARN